MLFLAGESGVLRFSIVVDEVLVLGVLTCSVVLGGNVRNAVVMIVVVVADSEESKSRILRVIIMAVTSRACQLFEFSLM